MKVFKIAKERSWVLFGKILKCKLVLNTLDVMFFLTSYDIYVIPHNRLERS